MGCSSGRLVGAFSDNFQYIDQYGISMEFALADRYYKTNYLQINFHNLKKWFGCFSYFKKYGFLCDNKTIL